MNTILTTSGREFFRPGLWSLIAWGNRHFAPEGASVVIVDAGNRSARVTPVLMDADQPAADDRTKILDLLLLLELPPTSRPASVIPRCRASLPKPQEQSLPHRADPKERPMSQCHFDQGDRGGSPEVLVQQARKRLSLKRLALVGAALGALAGGGCYGNELVDQWPVCGDHRRFLCRRQRHRDSPARGRLHHPGAGG